MMLDKYFLLFHKYLHQLKKKFRINISNILFSNKQLYNIFLPARKVVKENIRKIVKSINIIWNFILFRIYLLKEQKCFSVET